jgi:hypothetical protein
MKIPLSQLKNLALMAAVEASVELLCLILIVLLEFTPLRWRIPRFIVRKSTPV